MNAIASKISGRSIDNLQKMARMLASDTQDGATDVLDAILAQLETMMPAADFIAFCEEMEG